MLRPCHRRLFGTLILVLSFAATAARAEVTFSIVSKEAFVRQQGPAGLDIVPDEEPFFFNAMIGVESQGDLSNPTLRRIGGEVHALVFGEDDSYELDEGFASLEDLEAAYPSGDYVITYTPSGGSAVSTNLSLTGAFPSPPLLGDWYDLQHIVADQEVVIRWGEFIGGTADDMIVVEVNDTDSDNVVFETGIHLFDEEDSLDGTARSLTLPAGTLTPGQSYEAYFLFFDLEEVDETNGFAASFHMTELETTLRAVTRHPGTVIDSGIIGRWTAHRQTGPDTVNALSGEGAAWVFASIWLDDNDDLNSARLDHQHNLVLSPEQDGWAFLHTLSSREELLAWLPGGDHSLSYGFTAGGSHQTTLNLSGDLPEPVRIANWDELQNASFDEVTTIRWNDPGNVRELDGFIITIYAADGSGDTVFATDLDLDPMSGLFGPVTSVEIPAGTLDAGASHKATINFMRFADIDRNSQAGAWFVAANGVETEFTINTGATGGSDPVQVGGVGRDVYYFQSEATTVELHPDDPDQFMSFGILVGEAVDGLVSASVTLPGGAVRALQYDADDGEWISETHNANLDALLADFADGDYALNYTVSGGSEKEVVVTLGSTFPGVPRITNWSEAQSVLASEAFTLTWTPIDNMTEVDAIMIYIDDADDDGVYYDFPAYFINESGLRGTAVSATIPAGALEANQTYDVEINALHFTDFNDSGEGQIFGAFNLSNTLFQLVTTDGNQPPAITTESLEDAHEGQAYRFSVRASDAEDGFEVDMRAPVLPGWLTFEDRGGGEGVLSGTPSTTHVGAFTVSVLVTDGQGKTDTRDYTLTVHPDLGDPEGRALDIASITWNRDQASPFEAQISEVQYGESALISGVVGDGGISFLRGTFTGPMDLSFYWKVSSEAGKDVFKVEVDDTVEAEISGEQNWRRHVLSLPAGSHSVVWSYEKDGSGSSGADRGWLDHLTILPVQSLVYSGTYLGSFDSSSGAVAVYIRPDKTAVFLGHHPESGTGLTNAFLEISESNQFGFEVANPNDTDEHFVVSGSVTHLLVGGAVSGLDLTFSATRVPEDEAYAAFAGYYENALLATSGRVHLVVASDGRTCLFAEDGSYVEGVITAVDVEGRIAVTTGQGAEFDLRIDSATNRVTGSYTPPVGKVYGVLGLREGAPGDERLANISTRGQVLDGDKVMIASFVITGSGSKQLLIRAIGPKLADFGLVGTLPDPLIELIRLGESAPMSRNDDWSDNQQVARAIGESERLGAFALNPGDADSVLLLSLEPGAYTATVRGGDGGTGVGLVEVYDADDPAERRSTADVVNIATRGEVGTGADILIAGFVISGDVPKRVLIRGIGPTLGTFGVQGVLEDPRIDLIDSSQNLVVSNDDWGDNEDLAAVISSTAQVGAFALDDGSMDAVLLIWLEPGSYTAQVSGADGGTGVALIEVYDN